MEKETRVQRGMGLESVLTLIFVCCKLFGVIDWSWWWVFAPIWMPWVILGSVALVGLVAVGIVALIRNLID